MRCTRSGASSSSTRSPRRRSAPSWRTRSACRRAASALRSTPPLYALGRSQVPALVHSFIKLLAAEDPQVVNVASYVLGYARWAQAVPYLKFVATRSFAPTAEAAIWALGETRSADALEALLALATHGKHLDTVVPALGTLGDPLALEVLAPLLASKIPHLRLLAASAIWSVVNQHKARKKEWEWAAPAAAAGEPRTSSRRWRRWRCSRSRRWAASSTWRRCGAR